MKQRIKMILGILKLLWLLDFLRYLMRLLKTFFKNRRFKKLHPGFICPPSYIQYETTNSVDVEYYWKSGIEHAKYISDLIKPFVDNKPLNVLEWGCGSARVIQHLFEILPQGSKLNGTDYNKTAIEWAKKNYKSIKFEHNNLYPPLEYPDNCFDIVYAISIFTHLSLENCLDWMKELSRIVVSGGILVFTTHGSYYTQELLPREQDALKENGFISRAHYKEGKKWFTAYHNKMFVQDEMAKGFEILRHIEQPPFSWFHQDFWVCRKIREVE